MPDAASPVARLLVGDAARAGLTVATAESLTAGQIAATIADVPGASSVLRGGLVVYATDLKTSLAGVDAGLLSRVGPVDADVARELAAGAAARCGADIGVGVTGVAGPDSQDGHPVGEVYLAVHSAARGGFDSVRRLDDGWRDAVDDGSGSAADIRRAVRSHTTLRALELLRTAVDSLFTSG
ncbi:MAG: CinA family protein [Mycobacteriaceae bacterium]